MTFTPEQYEDLRAVIRQEIAEAFYSLASEPFLRDRNNVKAVDLQTIANRLEEK